MTEASFVALPANETMDQVLPGLAATGLSSVWLLGTGRLFAESDVLALLAAFEPRVAHLWHVSSGGYRSAAMKVKLRAFGAYPRLVTRVYYRVTAESAQETVYADSGECSGDVASLASFLNRSTAGADSSLVLLRRGALSREQEWAHASLPILSNWLSRGGTSSGTGAEWLLSSVRATVSAGGLPTILCVDASMNVALGVFGPAEDMTSPASLLSASPAGHSALHARLARGLRPQALW